MSYRPTTCTAPRPPCTQLKKKTNHENFEGSCIWRWIVLYLCRTMETTIIASVALAIGNWHLWLTGPAVCLICSNHCLSVCLSVCLYLYCYYYCVMLLLSNVYTMCTCQEMLGFVNNYYLSLYFKLGSRDWTLAINSRLNGRNWVKIGWHIKDTSKWVKSMEREKERRSVLSMASCYACERH